MNGQIPDVSNQWSPRLSVSYSPDPKTAIRFAAGRYWSRTPALLWAQLFSSNGLRGVQYTSTTNNGGLDPTDPNCKVGTTSCFDPLAPPWGTKWTPEGLERVNLSVLQPGRSGLPIFTVDPNFTNPHTDRATLNFERELFYQVIGAMNFTYAKGNQLERLTDANRAYDGTFAANGMPRYSSTRPNTFYAGNTQYVSDAHSKYYAVDFQMMSASATTSAPTSPRPGPRTTTRTPTSATSRESRPRTSTTSATRTPTPTATSAGRCPRAGSG